MPAYGKIIKDNNLNHAVHSAFWGNNACLFLDDKDSPDDGTATYYSDANRTTVSTVTFDVNGEVRKWQCSYPYKSDGTPRNDFWFNDSLGINTTTASGQKIIMTGVYSPNLVSTQELVADGIVLVESIQRIGTEPGAGTPFRDFAFNIIFKFINLRSNFNGPSLPIFNNCSILSLFGDTNGAYALTCKPALKESNLFQVAFGTAYVTLNTGIEITDSNVYNLTVPSAAKINVMSIYGSTLLNYSGILATSDEEFSNILGGSLDGDGYISVNPELSNTELRDSTVALTSPNFKNAAIDKSLNIGKAILGIPMYRGEADNNSVGLVSAVTTADQRITWIEGTNSFSGSKTLDIPVYIEGFKLIGVERLDEFTNPNFGAPNASEVFSSSTGFATDYSLKWGRPVIYVKVTVGSTTLVSANDLPTTVDGITTANYIPIELSTGAQYIENQFWINVSNEIVYNAVDPASKVLANVVGLTLTTLADLMNSIYIDGDSITTDLLAYFHDKTDVNLFQGITLFSGRSIVCQVKDSGDNPLANINVKIDANDNTTRLTNANGWVLNLADKSGASQVKAYKDFHTSDQDDSVTLTAGIFTPFSLVIDNVNTLNSFTDISRATNRCGGYFQFTFKVNDVDVIYPTVNLDSDVAVDGYVFCEFGTGAKYEEMSFAFDTNTNTILSSISHPQYKDDILLAGVEERKLWEFGTVVNVAQKLHKTNPTGDYTWFVGDTPVAKQLTTTYNGVMAGTTNVSNITESNTVITDDIGDTISDPPVGVGIPFGFTEEHTVNADVSATFNEGDANENSITDEPLEFKKKP